MDFVTLINDVGFPIAGALAAGIFVYLTLKFILNGVTDSVTTLKGIISSNNEQRSSKDRCVA
jgi:hypothetical protein